MGQKRMSLLNGAIPTHWMSGSRQSMRMTRSGTYTWRGKAYTCEKCYEGHSQLRKLPMWYKRAFER